MTSHLIHNGPDHPFPGGVKETTISCDHEGCGTVVNHEQINEGGGLKAMGWLTEFDDVERVLKHHCPKHNPTLIREGREL